MRAAVTMHAAIMAGADANADAMFTGADVDLRIGGGRGDADSNESGSDQE